MNIDYKEHIVLDSIETWPKELQKFLNSLESEIRKYREVELNIDKEAKLNVLLRVNRRRNDYDEYWKYAVSEVKNFIKNKMIVGFHCSRLTEGEIFDVEKNGLRPLSFQFAVNRINTLLEHKFISPNVAKRLLGNNKCKEENRNENVCFFHCLSTLKDESGLHRLFRAWGGEAIYSSHEFNSDIFHELTLVGTPSIVVASLYPDEVGLFNDIEQRIIDVWIDRIIDEDCRHDCDTIVRRQVKVLQIIKKEDAAFEELTNYSNWNFEYKT
jgi:hypothetical protein